MWWWFTWMGGCGCGLFVIVCVLVWGCERDWSLDLAPRKQQTFPLIPGWSGKEPQAAARRKQAEKKEAAIEEERATFQDLSEQGERKRERVSEWELVNSHIFSQRVSCKLPESQHVCERLMSQGTHEKHISWHRISSEFVTHRHSLISLIDFRCLVIFFGLNHFTPIIPCLFCGCFLQLAGFMFRREWGKSKAVSP